MNPLDVLILAMATFRLTSLIAQEAGPWDIFERFRRKLGVTTDPRSYLQTADRGFAKGLICVWCNSVWVAVALTVVYMLWPFSVWLMLPFALSTAAMILQEYVMGE